MYQTRFSWGGTDFGAPPIMYWDRKEEGDPEKQQTSNAFNALSSSLLYSGWDRLLFLEDDLEFNKHIRHNLLNWEPAQHKDFAFGSLYNPNIAELERGPTWFVADPNAAYGSQAMLLSRFAVEEVVKRWDAMPEKWMQDLRITRILSGLGLPLHYHRPSLVQHVGQASTWGGPFHHAIDFNPDWRAVSYET